MGDDFFLLDYVIKKAEKLEEAKKIKSYNASLVRLNLDSSCHNKATSSGSRTLERLKMKLAKKSQGPEEDLSESSYLFQAKSKTSLEDFGIKQDEPVAKHGNISIPSAAHLEDDVDANLDIVKTKKKKKSPVKKKAPIKKVAPAKPAIKPTIKKKAVVKKAAAPAKPVVVVAAAPKKTARVEKKPATPVKSGKAQIQEMKNKVFRRSPTDVQSFQPYRAKNGEEYMSTPQCEHFRNILMDWKKVLMQEVDRTVHHMQDEAANFPDPNDRATQEEEFALELRTRDRERKLIRKIDEAVISLETGDYGYCEVCGVEIGVKRLEARPTATLCIDCKTLDEIKEKQLG